MSSVALDTTEAIPAENGTRLRLTVQDNDMVAVSQAIKGCTGGGCLACDSCDSSPCGPVYCSHC
ncbi:hypothetical protein [Streptomyces sp. B6B3]|uniref:hypothetical protein n=1 Tax=Streptomyces sp. B6B3 TaxID=3153570 RepID=UPI00325EF0FB